MLLAIRLHTYVVYSLLCSSIPVDINVYPLLLNHEGYAYTKVKLRAPDRNPQCNMVTHPLGQNAVLNESS